MPDYNPDKESWADHRFIVQKAWPGAERSIKTGTGELEMGKRNRMMIKDEALAREIQSEFPRDYTVTRVRYPDKADRGHKYFFSIPFEMPWKRKKEEE